VRIIHKRGHRFGRADAHSGNAAKLSDGGRSLCLMVELLFDTSQLTIERFDLLKQQVAP
jgi:hypothetical protein